MRLAACKNRRSIFALTALPWLLAQLSCGAQPALGDGTTGKLFVGDEVILEETTFQKDPKLTWKVLHRALERVRQGRLDEADQWLMYAMRNASSDPLLESAEDIQNLVNGLAPSSPKNPSLSAENPDVRVLQSLIQTRMGFSDKALETMRSVEKAFPVYKSMNQVKSRVRTLDQILHPPKQDYIPDPRELSAIEYQAILERIAKEKVAISENQKTLDQALGEVEDEQLEKYSRWRAKRYPLKVFIPTDLSCAKITGYGAGDRNSVIAAFQLWQKAMKEQIKFIFVDSAAKADITCEWVDHPNKLGNKSKDVVGTCQTTCEKSFSIVHARIRMLTVFYKNTAPHVAAYRKNFLRNVALHEIGHALGLDHLPNEKSIMFFQVRDPLLETLTADDLGAMQEVVAVTQKEAHRDANYALAKPKIDVAKSKIASASERLKAEEDKIRYLVTNIDSQLKAAKDLERLCAWDHAFSIYDDAFKYRPHDETIRQNICRTANYAGRVALKKGHATQAIKYLSRGRELMNKDTPAEVRQQILETLRQSCEMNNQPKEAAEVQAILQNGNF